MDFLEESDLLLVLLPKQTTGDIEKPPALREEFERSCYYLLLEENICLYPLFSKFQFYIWVPTKGSRSCAWSVNNYPIHFVNADFY